MIAGECVQQLGWEQWHIDGYIDEIIVAESGPASLQGEMKKDHILQLTYFLSILPHLMV